MDLKTLPHTICCLKTLSENSNKILNKQEHVHLRICVYLNFKSRLSFVAEH